jgi:hypothetical protein
MKLWIAKIPAEKAPHWISQWEWDTVRQMFRSYANALYLRDWWLGVDRNYIEPSDNDKGPYAQIAIINGAHRATLKLSKRWPLSTILFAKKQSLVHELIHCHLKPVGDVVQFDLRQVMGEAMYNALWNTFERLEEYCVDSLADAIAEMLPPYPVEPKPKLKPKRRRRK